jgi:ABC-type glycerol-3-phosphate transport system substrate-binding protein
LRGDIAVAIPSKRWQLEAMAAVRPLTCSVATHAVAPALDRRNCLTALASVALSSSCTSRVRGRTLRVWAHQGQEAEHRALLGIASAFNRAFASRGLRAEPSFFPDFQYTEKLSIAAAAGDMPAAFELDGPLVARFVDANLLARLDGFFDRDELADFLPSIITQGTVGGSLYALGAFDSGALLYFDRPMLEQAGIELPDTSRGWDWPEFMDACSRLARHGTTPVALHMNESADEWFTYAFSSIVWSGGGALIAPNGTSVRGVLASAQNVHSLRAWQLLFARRYALADPIDPDSFGKSATAMDWNGHWMLRSHLASKGERLGVMPLPRAGDVAVAPCGS